MSDYDGVSDEELLALAEAGKVALPGTVLRGPASMHAWVRAFNVREGRAMAIEATDLYRHFEMWCAEEGHEPAPRSVFCRGLRAHGFQRSRAHAHGRDIRPYTFNMDTAKYFKDWLEKHPTPPGARLAMLAATNYSARVRAKVEDV